jgi:hypothetical protein
MKNKFHETKSWNVETYQGQYEFKGGIVTITYFVDRVISKWFWGFYKSDTLKFRNNFATIANSVVEMLDRKGYYKLCLRIEIEMQRLRLKHVR